MALIVCPECGKKFSDKAAACPECGCPVEAALASEENFAANAEFEDERDNSALENDTCVIDDDPNLLDRIGDKAEDFATSVVEKRQYPSYGLITIDEANRRFSIDRCEIVKGKDNAVLKLARGSLAVATLGVSVLGEKALKAGKNALDSFKWYRFDDFISFVPVVNNVKQYSGAGASMAVSGGLRISSHNGASKNVSTSAFFWVTVKNGDKLETIKVPIFDKPLHGRAYDKASVLYRETMEGLNRIACLK